MITTIVGTAALAGASLYGYKVLTNRSGEAAIQYLPADVAFVLTLDTKPSERQAVTFANISNSLSAQGLPNKFDKWMDSMLTKEPMANEIREQLSKDFALGVWPAEGKDSPHVVCLMAVKDPAKVTGLLTKNPPNMPGGVIKVLENYLVIADSENSYTKILGVKGGSSPSVASLANYKEARAALPADANLMAFVSYDKAQKFAKDMGGDLVANNGVTGYMSMGLTIEPDGLAIDCFGNAKDAKGLLSKLGETYAELKTGNVETLPGNTMGLMAVENASRWVTYMRDAMKDQKALDVNKSLDEFTKQTGMDIDKDIMPAFEGTFSVAAYPGKSGKPEDLDILIALHGDADATSNLAQKIKALVSKPRDNAKPLTWNSKSIGNNTIWTLQDSLSDAIGDKSQSNAFMQKRMGFVETPQGVLFGTSETVLYRAMSAAEGSQSLKHDAAYIGSFKKAEGKTEMLVMINAHRIMQMFREPITSSLKGSDVIAEDVLGIFGPDNSSIVSTGRLEGGKSYSKVFIPLDYDKLIRVIGASTAERKNSSSDSEMQIK